MSIHRNASFLMRNVSAMQMQHTGSAQTPANDALAGLQ